MDGWLALRFLHLIAMAFFVGGQLVLAAAVVPVQRREPAADAMRAMARRYGYGSLIAIAALVASGAAMAGHYGVWGTTELQVKLGLVALTAVFVLWHMRRPQMHVFEGVVFLLSLATVWLGISLSH